VFELAEPCPSSLYKNAKLFPGNGASSTISASVISVEIISKLVLLPSTVFVKL